MFTSDYVQFPILYEIYIINSMCIFYVTMITII